MLILFALASIMRLEFLGQKEGQVKHDLFVDCSDGSEIGEYPRQVRFFCRDGRVPTAIRIGRARTIPDNIEKIADGRIKLGKYI